MANLKTYKKILEDNDLEFVKFFKENKRSYIVYICKIHGEQIQRFDGFKMCKICSLNAGYKKQQEKTSESLESVKKWIKENSNAEIMTNEYVNSNTLYWFKCECGNGFLTSMNEFRSGNKRQCNICGVKRRALLRSEDFNYYYNKIKEFNKSELLGIEKVNSKMIFKLRCFKCNKIFFQYSSAYYKSIEKTCRECSIKIRNIKNTLTLEYVLNYLAKYDLKLLSKFKNTRTKIKIQCSCGRTFTTKFNRIHNSSFKVCRQCAIRLLAENNTMSSEDFIERFKKLNSNKYKLLNKYSRYTESMKIQHLECGNTYYIKSKSLLTFPTVCPYCNMTKGEDKIANFLKDNNIKFIPQYRFDNCRNINPLPFDFYLPDYNMTIEYDGKQHYFPNEFFGGIKAYQKTKKNDLIKNKFCREDEMLRLVRISYQEIKQINKILKYLLMI